MISPVDIKQLCYYKNLLMVFQFAVLLDTMKEIEKIVEIFLRNVKTMNKDRRIAHLESINLRYAKTLGFGDDKVQLAMQTYEMVSFFDLSIIFAPFYFFLPYFD